MNLKIKESAIVDYMLEDNSSPDAYGHGEYLQYITKAYLTDEGIILEGYLNKDRYENEEEFKNFIRLVYKPLDVQIEEMKSRLKIIKDDGEISYDREEEDLEYIVNLKSLF